MDSTEAKNTAPEVSDLGTRETLAEKQPNAAEAIYAAIADKVRADSQNLGAPIHVEDLGPLFADLTPEQIVQHLTELIQIVDYQDVKVITSTAGATYLYSDTVMSPEEAGEQVLAQETQIKIAEKVREDSQADVRLTAVGTLAELAPDLPTAKVVEYATAMAGTEKYPDIQCLTGPTGIPYLFSEIHMTRNYAIILARVEAKNPYAMIAETVREESRIYPRPTKVELFYALVFQIPEDQMEMIVEGLLRRDEYGDIKKAIAPTQAIYLYSDRYMVAPHVESWIQWEEVDKFNNP